MAAAAEFQNGIAPLEFMTTLMRDTLAFAAQWDEVPDNQVHDNGFKAQWEDFIRHVVAGRPWRFDLMEGVKGVQLAELALKSWAERRWIDVPDLAKLISNPIAA